MRLMTKRVRLLPIEPVHYWQAYQWHHSGDYEDFFGNVSRMNFEKVAMLRDTANVFVILDALDNTKILGLISMIDVHDRNRNLNLGILIDRKYQRLGAGKDALKLILYYIMNCMNFYKVIATAREGNIPSIKGLESFGFELEGVLKHEIYCDGEFKNVLRYAITKGPFNKRFKQEVETSLTALSHKQAVA